MADKKKTKYSSDKDKASTMLIDIAKSKYKFFNNKDGETFVQIETKGYKELLHVNSESFGDRMRMWNYKKTSKGLSKNVLETVISTLEAVSKFEGETIVTHQRYAQVDDVIYIDTCNDRRDVIKVDKFGWRIGKNPSIFFTRTTDMQELPIPESGGDIRGLLKHINIDKPNLPLLTGWMLMTMQAGKGAYALLSVDGMAGSGKSTACRMIKKLIDPNKAPLLSQPKPSEIRVISSGHHVLGFDNFSRISPELSDTFCRITTGDNQAFRVLYTTNSSMTVSIKKPIMINAITEAPTRSDLISRTISLHLNKIETRKTEEEAWESFDKDAPKLFGSLLDGLSCALRNYKTTKVDNMSRLADLCIWATAASSAFGWEESTFMDAYIANVEEAHSNAVEASPFGEAIRNMFEARNGYHGRPLQLIAFLEYKQYVSDKAKNSSSWARTARGAVDQLDKLKPSLEAIGIYYKRYKDRTNKTFVMIGDENFTGYEKCVSHQDVRDLINDEDEDLDF